MKIGDRIVLTKDWVGSDTVFLSGTIGTVQSIPRSRAALTLLDCDLKARPRLVDFYYMRALDVIERLAEMSDD